MNNAIIMRTCLVIEVNLFTLHADVAAANADEFYEELTLLRIQVGY